MDPAAKKRRLEDLMGGGSGAASAPAAPGPSPGPSSAPAAPSRDTYLVNANEALSFRLVTCPEDLEAAPCFNPEFTHQVFREDETIFGYLDLEVRSHRDRGHCQGAATRARRAPAGRSRGLGHPWVWTSSRPLTRPPRAHRAAQVTLTLHAVTFHALVEIKHGGTAPSVLGPPDKVEARLREAFPAGFTTDRAAFCDTLRQLGPSPPLPSDCVDVGVEGAACGDARVVLLALTSPEARAWHARLAPLVLFFIDAGTHLNTECVHMRALRMRALRRLRLTPPASASRKDSRWELLVALLPGPGGHGTHVVAGFATLYRFYAFPEGTRLRLSQVLVLHPLQRRGVASTLMQAVRAVAVTHGAVDFTVEDPTDALQKLRVCPPLERITCHIHPSLARH
jgi:histone acetyltransferase 1